MDEKDTTTNQKKDASEYNPAIKELEDIKTSLSGASTVEEINRLLEKFEGVASTIPSEFLPPELTISTVSSEAESKRTEIATNSVALQEHSASLSEGEKAAEQVLGNVIDFNKKLENFLDREEVNVSSKRNEAWAQDHNLIEASTFIQSHEKEEKEELRHMESCVEISIEKELERVEKKREELVKRYGVDHKEVTTFVAKSTEHLQRGINNITRLAKRAEHKASILGSEKVKEELGEEKAEEKEKLYKEHSAKLSGIVSKEQAKLDKWKEKNVAKEKERQTIQQEAPEQKASEKIAKKIIDRQTQNPEKITSPSGQLSPSSTPGKGGPSKAAAVES
jgi:acetolactate synthase small subunit